MGTEGIQAIFKTRHMERTAFPKAEVVLYYQVLTVLMDNVLKESTLLSKYMQFIRKKKKYNISLKPLEVN